VIDQHRIAAGEVAAENEEEAEDTAVVAAEDRTHILIQALPLCRLLLQPPI